MAWLGIWFEHEAEPGKARSPEHFRGLVSPIVYPYARSFIEGEAERLARSRDPGSAVRDGERFKVYYSLSHDGGQTGLSQQGCRIVRWLFEAFDPDATPSQRAAGALFSETPVVIHEPDPAKAAALGNALTLLRFLVATEDQAVAKIMLHPWSPFRGSPRLAAEEYERRVIELLHGEIFYPEEVTLFDVLERQDLRSHRPLGPCCETEIGFLRSLLDWVDDCRPESPAERRDLEEKLRRSLTDEARYRRKRAGAPEPVRVFR